MRRIALCLLAVAVIGAGARCGDDDPPLTADEFAARANAICKQGDAKLAEAGSTILKDATTPEQRVEFYLEHAVTNGQYKIEEIRKLKPPTKDKAKVKKMLDAGEKATEIVEEGLKKEGAAFQGGASNELLKEFDTIARELKLDDCATKS